MTDFEKYKKLFIETNINFNEGKNTISIPTNPNTDLQVNSGDDWLSADFDFDDKGKLICFSIYD